MQTLRSKSSNFPSIKPHISQCRRHQSIHEATLATMHHITEMEEKLILCRNTLIFSRRSQDIVGLIQTVLFCIVLSVLAVWSRVSFNCFIWAQQDKIWWAKKHYLLDSKSREKVEVLVLKCRLSESTNVEKVQNYSAAINNFTYPLKKMNLLSFSTWAPVWL